VNFKFKIFNCNQSQEWNSLLSLISDSRKSPHFRPEYYSLFEDRKEGRGICFAGVDDEKVVLYPALINCINDLGYNLDNNYFDLQGAYGYNGPVSNSTDVEFLQKFGEELTLYFKNKRIIAEFIRFCPVIQNQNYLNYISPVYTLDNVMIDLRPGLDYIWEKSFDRGVRKAIRKSEGNGLEFKMFNGFDIDKKLITSFLNIYRLTMDRNKADNYYYFSPDFILSLVKKLAENCLMAFVLKDNIVITAELILHNQEIAYGFLGGTDSDYYDLSPNSFLRYQLIKSLIEKGITKYSIGGGKSKDDSVYSYKKSFSRYLDSRFYIGRKIHNETVYNTVVALWKAKFPEKVEKFDKLLLKYRF
jgi:hypothetical protein